jgi:hypothetical protein
MELSPAIQPASQPASQPEDLHRQHWITQDKNFFDGLKEAGGIPAARSFKTLGMCNLLILQTMIQSEEKNLENSFGKDSFKDELDVLMAKLRDYSKRCIPIRRGQNICLTYS